MLIVGDGTVRNKLLAVMQLLEKDKLVVIERSLRYASEGSIQRLSLIVMVWGLSIHNRATCVTPITKFSPIKNIRLKVWTIVLMLFSVN